MNINSVQNTLTGIGAENSVSQTPAAANPTAATLTAEQARKHQKLVKAAQDFEAVFVGSMLKQMRKSISGDKPLFGASQQAKLYQDMMDDATAQQMSRTGSFGLAKLLTRSLDHTISAGGSALQAPDPKKRP